MEQLDKCKFSVSIAVFLSLAVMLSGFGHAHVEAQEEPVLSIIGLVEKPVNITYSEFYELPMITKEATCTCVGYPPEDVGVNAYDVYAHNWTGVQISALLEMVAVKPEAVDVVFHATDGYSSSLSLETAPLSSSIIAVEADGETLTRGTGYPFRLVVPCWWGYKWVKFVDRIEVVDYDHKGTWESSGYPDDAEIPDCIDPEIDEEEKRPIVASPTLAISGIILLGLGIYLAKR